MAEVSVTYLSFDTFDEGPCEDDGELDQRLDEYHLLRFACFNWGHHAMVGQDNELIALAGDFIRSKQKLASSVQVLHMPRSRIENWHDRYRRNFSPLHATADWGFDKLLPEVLEEDNIDRHNSHGATALHLSSQRGQPSTALGSARGASLTLCVFS